MGHKKRRANARLYCVQRDKEPLGVWMVSSPVSREAGRQPDKNILLTLLVDSKHHSGQHTVCHPAPLRQVQSRILCDYSKADPKQTNKQKKGGCFLWCHSLLHRDEAGCVQVQFLPGFERMRRCVQECETTSSKSCNAHIYVTSSIHINIGLKYVFQPFSLYQTQQRNSPHPCWKTWCGVNDKLVNVSICCTASATAALCNRQAQTWLLWMEQREGRSWLVSFF